MGTKVWDGNGWVEVGGGGGGDVHPVVRGLRDSATIWGHTTVTFNEHDGVNDTTAATQGAVCAPDGKIYGIPAAREGVFVYDPADGTVAEEDFGLNLLGTSKWWGGVLGPDGMIYGIPHYSTDFLVIDPTNGTARRDNFGAAATLSGDSKWAGGVVAPDGKIYGIPMGSPDILIFDPAAGTVDKDNFGASKIADASWVGGTLAPDGKIYCAPSNHTKPAADPGILVIDPVNESASIETYGEYPANYRHAGGWAGAYLGADGRIYFVPRVAPFCLILDPMKGEVEFTSFGLSSDPGSKQDPFTTHYQKWMGGALGLDGKLYCSPYQVTPDLRHVLVIDTMEGTAERHENPNFVGSGYFGSAGVLGLDGKIVVMPANGSAVDVYDTHTPSDSAWLTLSPYLNKY